MWKRRIWQLENIPEWRRGRRVGAEHRPELKGVNFVTNIPELRYFYLRPTDRCVLHNAPCNMYIWFTVLAGLAVLSLSFLKTLFPYLGEDCAYILRSLKLGARLVKYKRIKPFYSILDCFLDAAERQPSKTFLHFEGREYSYGEVDKQSNKVARALQAEAGLKEGDAVALFLANEPSFVWTWLGLAKLGCPAALLNFNIRSKSLLHCFSCCGAKVIIASPGETH